MSRIRWSALLVIAGIGALSAPVSYAKPPDLPDAGEVFCQDDGDNPPAFRWELLGGRVQIDIGLSRVAPPTNAGGSLAILDAWCPNLVPLVVQRLHQAMSDAFVRAAADPEEAESARLARELFEAACRSARAGQTEPARNLLKKAHMTNPTCHYGQLAIQRLLEMEANDNAGEASVPPVDDPSDEAAQAERSFRRVRSTTVPLGTVPGQTY